MPSEGSGMHDGGCEKAPCDDGAEQKERSRQIRFVYRLNLISLALSAASMALALLVNFQAF